MACQDETAIFCFTEILSIVLRADTGANELRFYLGIFIIVHFVKVQGSLYCTGI